MYYITEYKKNAINKLIPYLLEFPQIVKITEMNAGRYQYIEDILWNIANNFKVNNARGSFLDIIAHNEGTNIVYADTVKVQDAFTYGSTWDIENPDSEEKNPQIYGTGKYYSDTTYLYNTEINVSEEQTIKAIKAQIIKNNTNGEAEDFIEAIKLYFNIDKVQILESYPLGISLVIGGDDLRISGTNNKEIIKTFLPICVSLNNLYLNDKTYNMYQLGRDVSYGTSRYPREISELISSYTYLSPSIRLKPEFHEYVVTNNNSIPNNSFCCISGVLNDVIDNSCILSSTNTKDNVSLIVKDNRLAINYNNNDIKSNIEAKNGEKYTITMANVLEENSISKFEVVGSPKITSDGVASGFLKDAETGYDINANGVAIKDFSIGMLKDKPYKISCTFECKDGTLYTLISNPSAGWVAWSNSLTISNNGLRIESRFGTEENNTGNIRPLATTSLASLNMSYGQIYTYQVEFDGTSTYKYTILDNKGLTIKSFTYVPTTDDKNLYVVNTKSTASVIIGCGNYAYYTQYVGFQGQIDLKQFSITVDGKEVFNGGKPNNTLNLWISNKIETYLDQDRALANLKNIVLNKTPDIKINDFVNPVNAPVYINCINKDDVNSNFCDFTYYAILMGNIKENNDIALNEYYTSCFGEKQILFNCLKNKNHLKIYTKDNLKKDLTVMQPDFTYNKNYRNGQCAYFDGKSGITYNTQIANNATKQIKELDLSFKMCVPFENKNTRIVAMFAGLDWSCLSFDENSSLMLGLGTNIYNLGPIELNKFYNIKIAIKDSIMKVYLDNIEILSETLDNIRLYGSENIYLGSGSFNGFIKDLSYKAIYNDNTIINLESDLTTTLRDDKNNIAYTNEGVRLITTPQLINDITNLDLYGNKFVGVR